MTTRISTNALGLVGAGIVGYFWFLMLAPLNWNFRFPGRGLALLATLVLSLIISLIAGMKGARSWFIVAAAALGTLVFIGLRMH